MWGYMGMWGPICGHGCMGMSGGADADEDMSSLCSSAKALACGPPVEVMVATPTVISQASTSTAMQIQ